MTPAQNELERQFLGALMNVPSAAKAARHVRPEFMEYAYHGDILAVMQRSTAGFTMATLVAEMSLHPQFEAMQGRAYIAGLFNEVAEYEAAAMLPLLADKIVKQYQRRASILLLTQHQNAIERGEDPETTLTGLQSAFKELRGLGNREPRFKPVPVCDIVVPITPWSVKGVLPRQGIGFVAGASGSSKTFFTIDTGMGLAAGRPFILEGRAKQCAVIYVAVEDPEGCKARVHAWRKEHNAPADLPFELIAGAVNLLDQLCVNDLCDVVAEAAQRFKAQGLELGLVVIDTLARATPGGDENSSEQMSLAVAAMEAIALASGAFVLAVAHHGKAGAAAGIRGWSGLNGASDMTITIERDEQDKHLRKATLSKIKNGIDGKLFHYRLRRVGLDLFDEDGEELDSCICAFEAVDDQEIEAKPKALTPPAEIVLKAVRYCTDNHETSEPPEGAVKQAWSRAVWIKSVQTVAVKNGLTIGQDQKAADTAFQSALQRLVAAGKVRVDTTVGKLWLI